MWKHSDTRSVKGGGNLIIGAAFYIDGGGGGGGGAAAPPNAMVNPPLVWSGKGTQKCERFPTNAR